MSMPPTLKGKSPFSKSNDLDVDISLLPPDFRSTSCIPKMPMATVNQVERSIEVLPAHALRFETFKDTHGKLPMEVVSAYSHWKKDLKTLLDRMSSGDQVTWFELDDINTKYSLALQDFLDVMVETRDKMIKKYFKSKGWDV
jgi:hypothetical protein